MQMKNKVALVTGGTSGIGLAAARLLAERSATVIVTGREGDRLRQVRSELGVAVTAMPVDVTDPADIARLMGDVRIAHGRIDALIVSAGVSDAPPITDLDPAAYAALMDVNCRGAVFAFVHALPLLAAGASVVFVGSVGGRKGQPGDPLYAGSKGFIRAFARSAGTDPELLARRIRINVVAPGPIATPLTAAVTEDREADAYVTGQLVPMHRWGRPEECGSAWKRDPGSGVIGVEKGPLIPVV